MPLEERLILNEGCRVLSRLLVRRLRYVLKLFTGRIREAELVLAALEQASFLRLELRREWRTEYENSESREDERLEREGHLH